MPTQIDTVIVTGVAGSGKSTVGLALADQLGWQFRDADDLHDTESVARIRRNQPLEDADRLPWLMRVRGVIEEMKDAGTPVVIACSALKEQYRRVLAEGLPGIRFVFLTGDAALLRDRLARRRGHFAGPGLLASQLADVEPPDDALWIDVSLPVETIVDRILTDLGPRAAPAR
ncbi:MAG TPA: gluconokinase, GntK/IdnK-type [Vicinamibacterales bacterium]